MRCEDSYPVYNFSPHCYLLLGGIDCLPLRVSHHSRWLRRRSGRLQPCDYFAVRLISTYGQAEYGDAISQQGQQLRLDTPTEVVLTEVQHFEAGKVGQFRGDSSSQLVINWLQVEDFKAGQAAQLWRNLASQLVCVQVKPSEFGEIGQLRRYTTP